MGQSSKEFDVIVSGPADVIPPNEAIPGKEYQCASIFAYVHRYIPTYMWFNHINSTSPNDRITVLRLEIRYLVGRTKFGALTNLSTVPISS